MGHWYGEVVQWYGTVMRVVVSVEVQSPVSVVISLCLK